MFKTPRAPVSGFTPQVRRATPGTAQQVAKDTASNGLEKSRGHRAVTCSASYPRYPESELMKRKSPALTTLRPGGRAGLASSQ